MYASNKSRITSSNSVIATRKVKHIENSRVEMIKVVSIQNGRRTNKMTSYDPNKEAMEEMKNEYHEEYFVCDVCGMHVEQERMSPYRKDCCKICSILIHYAANQFSYPYPYESALNKEFGPAPTTVVGIFKQFLKEIKKWNGYIPDELLKRILVEAGYDEGEITRPMPVKSISKKTIKRMRDKQQMHLSNFFPAEGPKVTVATLYNNEAEETISDGLAAV